MPSGEGEAMIGDLVLSSINECCLGFSAIIFFSYTFHHFTLRWGKAHSLFINVVLLLGWSISSARNAGFGKVRPVVNHLAGKTLLYAGQSALVARHAMEAFEQILQLSSMGR